jgi:hypothetical protein
VVKATLSLSCAKDVVFSQNIASLDRATSSWLHVLSSQLSAKESNILKLKNQLSELDKDVRC